MFRQVVIFVEIHMHIQEVSSNRINPLFYTKKTIITYWVVSCG